MSYDTGEGSDGKVRVSQVYVPTCFHGGMPTFRIYITHTTKYKTSEKYQAKPDALDDVVVETKLRQPRESLQVVDLQHILIRQTQSGSLCYNLSDKGVYIGRYS